MRHERRDRRGRRLVPLFLAVTLVPSVLLVMLGWRLFVDDRAAALRRVEDRRRQAAGVIVNEVRQQLAAIEAALDEPSHRTDLWPEAEAVWVTVSPEGTTVRGDTRPAFVPRPAQRPEARDVAFAPGEELEHRRGDSARAGAWFQSIARSSPTPAVRAGALIRLARNLRKRGETVQALAVLEEAGRIEGVDVSGTPSALLARYARCDLLAALHRRLDLQVEARRLLDDLHGGRWQLPEATYRANVADARAWLGEPLVDDAPPVSEQLAAAVSAVWTRHTTGAAGGWSNPTAAYRELEPVAGAAVLVVWRVVGEEFRAFATRSDAAERIWVDRIAPALGPDLRGALVRSAVRRAPSRGETSLTPDQTALPWTITVSSRDEEAELTRLATRRRSWIAALVLLTGLLVAGAAVTARAMSRELAAAKLQADFVSAVSHEFRTPLTTVRQLTETLADGRLLTEDRRQVYYAALGRQTERLQRLVENLLDFGRLESGRAAYRRAPVDLLALAQHVVREFTGEQQLRGTPAEIAVEGEAVVVRGDRDALASVLWNLVDNAVKYSPPHAPIRVRVDAAPDGATVRVVDSGVGIPRGEERRIFERFVRGTRAQMDHIKGTGIGLAIVKHVVEAHGGTVDVVSEPGVGSTFVVALPAGADGGLP